MLGPPKIQGDGSPHHRWFQEIFAGDFEELYWSLIHFSLNNDFQYFWCTVAALLLSGKWPHPVYNSRKEGRMLIAQPCPSPYITTYKGCIFLLDSLACSRLAISPPPIVMSKFCINQKNTVLFLNRFPWFFITTWGNTLLRVVSNLNCVFLKDRQKGVPGISRDCTCNDGSEIFTNFAKVTCF